VSIGEEIQHAMGKNMNIR